MIKLPLGIHKRTGKRALFIRPEGDPYADQLGLLEEIRKASRRAIYGAIQRLQARKHVSERPEAEAPPWDETAPMEAIPTPKTEAPISIVQEIYDLDRDPQFQTIVSRCPALQAIVEKVNQTSQLTKDETMVLIHTVGHLERGPEAVNELFQRCCNADPALFLKSRLRGNPMSCPKIRIRVPHITSAVALPAPLTLELIFTLRPLFMCMGPLQKELSILWGSPWIHCNFKTCFRNISSSGNSFVKPSFS